MTSKVGIINVGMAGNIRSISKAVEMAGGTSFIVESAAGLDKADKIVLPGVGSFPDAMLGLERSKLTDPLREAIGDRPTLGICLGMQILAKLGYEHDKSQGLGFFEAEVRPIECVGAVPHMGFNRIFVQNDSPLLVGLGDSEFYFMHSYEFVNYRDVIALTNYSSHEFVSAVQKEHIFGVQFHPEKSRDAGIELFRNFVKI